MPLTPTTPTAITLGTPSIWQVTSLVINTYPGKPNSIIVYFGSFDSSNNQITSQAVTIVDIPAVMSADGKTVITPANPVLTNLMSQAPTGASLYAAVKAAAYAFLTTNKAIPAGTVS